MTDEELLEAAAEAAYNKYSPNHIAGAWRMHGEEYRALWRAIASAALEVFRREQGERDEALRDVVREARIVLDWIPDPERYADLRRAVRRIEAIDRQAALAAAPTSPEVE